MRKTVILIVALFFAAHFVSAQRRMENLSRGLVAVKVSSGVYLSWRITGQEWLDASYNIYRDGVKITDSPITGASNYTDTDGSLTSKYKVSCVIDGTEQVPDSQVSVLPQARLDIKLKEIPKISGVPDSCYDAYTINDVVTGDLDGDGEYELIVKRVNQSFDSSNPFVNKYYTLFDAYKLDGTFLWRIDVGPNIFNNVEQNAFVYDLDGDGKAEVVMRTSEGTVDGVGNVIGDLGNAAGESTPDGITNYRDQMELNSSWYEFKGPEYLSLFDGKTGEMFDRIDIIARQPVSQWGPSGTADAGLAHRSTKFHYGAPYLDGKKPSLLVTRGIYYRIKMATYDIVDKKFVSKWTFDSGTGEYASQGYHNYSIADVDDDGRDEIVYGSMTVDDDGTGLYSTGLGHGDAIHVGDFDPYRKGLEVFACLETSPAWGTSFRKAENGEELYHYNHGTDCGRCMAANVSNSYAGAELWPTTNGVYSASERNYTSLTSGSVNFRIFWDGDLLDELVDHNYDSSLGKGVGIVQKLSESNTWSNLLQTDGYYSCNSTKGTPCLQADLFGDWREELIYRNAGDSAIAIFMTTIPTNYRIYTLMHDMQYREAIGWQMCGYNQPPHVSYFLGEKEKITTPPPPTIDNDKLVFNPATSTEWSIGTTNWTKNDTLKALQNGDNVLFDVTGHANNIKLTGTVSLKSLTVNSPNNYTIDMSSGKLSGSMVFVKQGKDTLSINGDHDYTGKTEIWDGLLDFDGKLENSPVWVNLFGEFAAKGTIGKSLTLNYGSVLYPGGRDAIDTLSVTSGNVVLKSNSIVEFDIDSAFVSDKLILSSDTLIVGDGAVFRINMVHDTLSLGDYVLAEAPHLSGDLSTATISGLSDKITSLSYENNKLILNILGTRASASVVWTGKNSGYLWNFATDYNFSLDGDETFFVEGDTVTFDDTSVSKTVNVSGTVIPGNILVNNSSTYVFQGDGVISGTTGLTKTGSGKLTLSGENDFTGAVDIEGGTLSVASMPYLTANGSIGQASDDPNLFIVNGGIFTSTASITSERALKVGSNGATISTNAAMYWKALISGGALTKTGSFNLSLYSADTNDSLKIKGGTVTLAAEAANPASNVVLYKGILQCYNSISSTSTATWNLIVPDGYSGTVNLDGRCTYSGNLTGSGDLTVYSPYVRSDISGNWSAFTGSINFTGVDIRLNSANSRNLANASVDLGSGTYLYAASNGGSTVVTGQPFYFGALSGSGGIFGYGNLTIGAKNTNTTYSGVIASGTGKLVKTGTGSLTLSGSNLYTGGTTISGGRLITANTSGSATGTGAVAVSSGGFLSGSGIVTGLVTANSGATIEPGDHTTSTWSDKIGTLSLLGGLTLTSNSIVSLSVNEVDPYLSDKIVIDGNFIAAGTLSLNIVNGGTSFPLGAKVQLFDLSGASSISGGFSSYSLPATDGSTIWDTSQLLVDGTIQVVASSGISSDSDEKFNVSPNPAHKFIIITDDMLEGKNLKVSLLSLDGSVALTTDAVCNEKINITALTNGAYLVKVVSEGKVYVAKILKD